MRRELVDDPVDEFPIGAKRDADEIEFLGGNGGDGRSIRLVVAGHEELAGVDRELRTPLDRAFVRTAGPPASAANTITGCRNIGR